MSMARGIAHKLAQKNASMAASAKAASDARRAQEDARVRSEQQDQAATLVPKNPSLLSSSAADTPLEQEDQMGVLERRKAAQTARLKAKATLLGG